jgi:hypothetical protein
MKIKELLVDILMQDFKITFYVNSHIDKLFEK